MPDVGQKRVHLSAVTAGAGLAVMLAACTGGGSGHSPSGDSLSSTVTTLDRSSHRQRRSRRTLNHFAWTVAFELRTSYFSLLLLHQPAGHATVHPNEPRAISRA